MRANTRFVIALSVYWTVSLWLPITEAGISDARFQRLFRVDLSGVKRISWKEWVKKYAQAPNGFPTFSGTPQAKQISCANSDLISTHLTRGACCDVRNDTCDSNLNLQCVDYRCACRMGSNFNDTTEQCERHTNKQLTETCTEAVDNCFTAFSACVSGICQCMEGFKPDGFECVPTIYRCPYGDPLMSGSRPQSCDVKESDSSIDASISTSDNGNRCQSGYECVYPADQYRPKFIILTGIEQGYCCPLIPDLNQTILFQEQCYYGDWIPPLQCPQSTHVYAMGISSAPLCCPKPCRPNYSMTILNGQCVESILP